MYEKKTWFTWEKKTSLRGTKQSFDRCNDCFVPRNDGMVLAMTVKSSQ